MLNNSWGQPGGFEQALERAIQESDDAGILFVAASGNGNILGFGVDNDRTPFYPASYEVDNVIAVAASNTIDQIASFSNFGATSVDIAAPGVNVLSTLPGGNYGPANGTSMAAPHVAGTAALVFAAFPQATVDEVKAAILESADSLVGGDGRLSTAGRLNTQGSLLANVFAPTARLVSAVDITSSGGTVNEITVEYGHQDGINVSTIGDGDLVIDRQWGPRDQIAGVLKTGSIVNNGDTVTATYLVSAPGGGLFSSDTSVPIDPVNPNTISSTISISGITQDIRDVNVMLDIDHTFDADLTATLISPTGVRVELFAGLGGSGENFRQTTFDDDADTLISTATAPFSGTFRPQQSLSALNGLSPNGVWTLEIQDTASDDGGRLNGWSLDFGGQWDPLDFGEYKISVGKGAVESNTNRVPMRAGGLGSFDVLIPEPGFFYVDSVGDGADANLADGVATDASGMTSLRAAVQEANERSNNDPQAESFILLMSGDYELTLAGSAEDDAVTGDLDVRSQLTILGDTRQSTRIVSAVNDRVFQVTGNGNLRVSRLSISGGKVLNDGGGIFVQGELDASDIEVTGNVAARGAAIGVSGGYVSLGGNSSIVGNQATNTDTLQQKRVGGAIFLDAFSSGTISGATIAANSGDGIVQLNGGVGRELNLSNTTVSSNSENGLFLLGDATLDHVTIAGNERLGINFNPQESGVPLPPDNEIRIRNTLIIQNGTGSITLQLGLDYSEGFNIIEDDIFGDLGSEIFNQPTDLATRDVTGIIQPLDFYGSPTRHHPLEIGSVAIDFGSTTLFTDQLGTPRPVDGNGDTIAASDVGAIEAASSDATGQPRVRGKIFDDRNRNGVLDDGESGVSGQLVFIDVNQNGQLDDGEPFSRSAFDNPLTTAIDESGSYVLLQSDTEPISVSLTTANEWVTSEPTIQRVSESSSGQGGNEHSGARTLVFNDQLLELPPAISGTGQFVGFATTATNLDGNVIDRGRSISIQTPDSDGQLVGSNGDILFYKGINGETQHFLLSATDGSVQTLGNPLPFIDGAIFGIAWEGFAITPDGRVRAFLDAVPAIGGFSIGIDTASGITHLVDPQDVFLRSNSDFSELSISLSPDGNIVAYTAFHGATQIVKSARIDTNTIVATPAAVGGGIPNADSGLPALNQDGSIMVFQSAASNLVANDQNGSTDVFMLRDGVVRRLSLRDGETEVAGDSVRPTISADGLYVAFASEARLSDLDTNLVSDIYVYSTERNEVRLVTLGADGASANGASFVPSLSADGRYIAFSSTASNLVPGDANGFSDVFVATNPFLGVLEDGFGATVAVSSPLEQFVDFAVVARPGSVSGNVFNDVLQNGIRDVGEPGFARWAVYVDVNRNGQRDDDEPFTRTDDQGDYQIDDLPANQSYSLRMEVPSGFVQVLFAENSPTLDFFLPAGVHITRRDFGARVGSGTGQAGNSSISGRIFDDKNSDGQFDAGDVPMSGVEVYLDSQNPGVRDENEPRVLTNDQGNYRFDNLGSRVVAVSTILDATTIHVSPLGSHFDLQTFPLFAAVTPFANPQAIAAGDFNGDGFADVAVALGEANKVSIRLNDQHGGFLADEIDVQLGSFGSGATSLVVGQWNDPGSGLDLAVANAFSSNVTVLLDFNASSGEFTSISSIVVGEEPKQIRAGDLNGDSVLDLVVVNKGNDAVDDDGSVQVLLNDGNGGFTALPAVDTHGESPVSLVVGEFTGDDFADVAVANARPLNSGTPNGGITLLAGNGTGALTHDGNYYEVAALPIDLVAADFDDDGRLDLAVSNFASNTISILRGNATGTFDVQAATLGTASGAFDIAVTDIDNDGDIDIIASNLLDRNISIFRNAGVQGSGDVQFEPLESVGLGQFSLAQRMPLVIANFDNDHSGPGGAGTNDIVTIPRQSDTLHVLRNTLVNGSYRVALTGANQIDDLNFVTQPARLSPSLNVIVDPVPILEDSSQQIIPLSGIAKGRSAGPPLRIVASSSNPDLISDLIVNHLDGNSIGSLAYTPIANASGQATIAVTVTDAGADQTFDTSDDTMITRTADITIMPVNDPPTFSLASSVVGVDQDSGETAIDGFVSGISAGGGEDGTQTLGDFIVSTDPGFFATSPVIDRQGRLSFTLASGVTGTVLVSVSLSDDGGVGSQGQDTRTKSFAITVLPIDPTSIVLEGDGNTFYLTQPNAQLDGIQLIDIRGTGENTLVLDVNRIRDVFSGGELLVLSDSGDQVVFDDGWQFAGAFLVEDRLVRQFAQSGAILNLVGPDDFTNPISPFDVNASGTVSSLDALQIINELGSRLFSDDRSNPAGIIRDVTSVDLSRFRFYDVSGDLRITAVDALRVINQLARQTGSGSGEGEAVGPQLASDHPQERSEAALVWVPAVTNSRRNKLAAFSAPIVAIAASSISDLAGGNLQGDPGFEPNAEGIDAVMAGLSWEIG